MDLGLTGIELTGLHASRPVVIGGETRYVRFVSATNPYGVDTLYGFPEGGPSAISFRDEAYDECVHGLETEPPDPPPPPGRPV